MKITVIAQALACAYFLLASDATAQSSSSAAPLAIGSTVNPEQAQPVINPVNEYTTIVEQAAEQNRDITASTMNLFDTAGAGAPPWFLRLLNTFFTEVGNLVGKWIHDFVVRYEAPAAGTLALVLQQRVFNPNVAAADGSLIDTVTPQIRRLNVLMYTIAQDLLLLIFILNIWKAWAGAAWHGGASLVAPVIRLCFTTALLLSWPTLSAFIIQISNEMIEAIYPASGTADAVQLAKGLQAVIDLGVDAAGAALIAMLSPLAATRLGGFFGSTGVDAGNLAAQSISFAAMLIFTVLATALIFQLIYIVTMQSAQTVLLYAQYMFAPFFLLFFAHPDTEIIAARYIRTVVESSIWSFVWVGLLRLLVILMTSPVSVWGQVLYALSVFQIMIDTPRFIAMVHISPLSDFVSAGLLSRRTVMFVRSFSTQAREHGMAVAKQFLKDQKAGTAAHKTVSSSSHRSSPTADDTQEFNGLRPAAQNIAALPSSTRSKRRSTKLNASTAGKIPAGFNAEKKLADSSFIDPLPDLHAVVHEDGDAGLPGAAPDIVLSEFKDPLNIASGTADPLTQAEQILPAAPILKCSSSPNSTSDIEPIPISYGNKHHQIIAGADGKLCIKTARGTSELEIARLHTIAGLAQLSFSDPQARSAALQAATNDEPSHTDASSHDSPPAQNGSTARTNLTIIKHAILGAQSYVDAQPGNAYCTYLHNRFGNLDSNRNIFSAAQSYAPLPDAKAMSNLAHSPLQYPSTPVPKL